VFYAGPDAAQIVTHSGSTVKVWDPWAKDKAKQPRVASFDGALSSLKDVAVGHDGRFLALGGFSENEQRVVIYRSDGGAYKEVKRVKLAPGDVEVLTLSADGRRLIVSYFGGERPRIYDDGVENAALRKRLDGLVGLIGKIALSANGRYLAVWVLNDFTGLLAGRTQLLDTSAGSWETLLDGENGISIAFSPDGAYVGVGSDVGFLRIFKTSRAKGGGVKGAAGGLKEEIVRLRLGDEVRAVAFSNDGRYVATASHQPQSTGEEEPLRIWLLRPAELIEESERRLGQAKPPGR
jgi:WD40 repeat protein